MAKNASRAARRSSVLTASSGARKPLTTDTTPERSAASSSASPTMPSSAAAAEQDEMDVIATQRKGRLGKIVAGAPGKVADAYAEDRALGDGTEREVDENDAVADRAQFDQFSPSPARAASSG